MMVVTVNGEEKDMAAGITVQEMIEQLGLNPKTVVVQRNDQIVERIDFGSTRLSDGDNVELVRFVGGG